MKTRYYIDLNDPNTPPGVIIRRARASFAFALIALAGSVACIMAGHWPPGLILVFAALSGILAARQLRSYASRRITDR